MNWPGEVAFHSTAWTIVREVSASRAQVTVPVCSASGHNFGHSARAIHSNKVSLGRFVASFVAKGPRCSASPLPLWESIGRLRRPFLEKDAEAKLRLRRIDRCDPGEGLRPIDRPRPLTPTLSHKGRGSAPPLKQIPDLIFEQPRRFSWNRHCERSEAIHSHEVSLDCFASLAMTAL